MERSEPAAWVFAGDSPGQWWIVHARPPRFAARLLSAEEFSADSRLARWVPHGINVAVPVHFNLGADVLVVTEFLDPLVLDESDSPPSAILTDAMIEALHACQRAISEIAAGDPQFAPLADRAEQFLVGWSLSRSAEGWLAVHRSGARVLARVDAAGDCEAVLQQMPDAALHAGWDAELLRQRLERVAGERVLLVDGGWDLLRAVDGAEIGADAFHVLAEQDRRRLSWSLCPVQLPGREGPINYVALRISGPSAVLVPTAVEVDARSPLHLGNRPLSEDDAAAIQRLRAGYGLSTALGLVAARHFGWFEEPAEDLGDRRRALAIAEFPCEVEAISGGELYAAVIFEPADARGLFRLVIVPHAPVPSNGRDPAALLPFEGMVCRREQFHVPRYLRAAG